MANAMVMPTAQANATSTRSVVGPPSIKAGTALIVAVTGGWDS